MVISILFFIQNKALVFSCLAGTCAIARAHTSQGPAYTDLIFSLSFATKWYNMYTFALFWQKFLTVLVWFWWSKWRFLQF